MKYAIGIIVAILTFIMTFVVFYSLDVWYTFYIKGAMYEKLTLTSNVLHTMIPFIVTVIYVISIYLIFKFAKLTYHEYLKK